MRVPDNSDNRYTMRFPLTKYGLREIVGWSIVCMLAAAVCWWVYPWLVVLPLVAWMFLICFFRDPERPCVCASSELLSPADGTVVDIEEVDAPAFLSGKTLRVGIFMSVFNVHVNRAPARGVVKYVRHVPGRFHDARSDQSKSENEHNLIGMELGDGRRVLINQIAGVIARRIVCKAQVGQELQPGERLGMIKFGSRVELYAPLADRPTPAVTIGATVKAGQSVLIRYSTVEPAKKDVDSSVGKLV
jgi:phosphatidylserine decarboxylase